MVQLDAYEHSKLISDKLLGLDISFILKLYTSNDIHCCEEEIALEKDHLKKYCLYYPYV